MGGKPCRSKGETLEDLGGHELVNVAWDGFAQVGSGSMSQL